jgi:hypothetical protein
MTRPLLVPLTCLLTLAACATDPDPGDPFTSLTAAASVTLTNTTTNGDGDGDGETGTGTGDGDGDTTMGDGDGDGDQTTGDGDGDGDPGDGDGDPTTGDGDGDGDPLNCGWNAGGMPAGYYCGFMGDDPQGLTPIDCPPGLVDGSACGVITGAGCCDVNGDNWYCADDGMGGSILVLEPCP